MHRHECWCQNRMLTSRIVIRRLFALDSLHESCQERKPLRLIKIGESDGVYEEGESEKAGEIFISIEVPSSSGWRLALSIFFEEAPVGC